MGAKFEKVKQSNMMIFDTQTSSKEKIELMKKQYESTRDTNSHILSGQQPKKGGESAFLESRLVMRGTKANGFDGVSKRPISNQTKFKVLMSNNDSMINELLPNV